MHAMATTTANPTVDKPAPSGKLKRLVLILLIGLVAAAAAAGGTYFVLAKEGVRGAAPSAPAPLAVPVFFALEPLTVNLQSDDGIQHYLRVGLSLKLTDAKAQEYLTQHMPELRSRILLALSNKHPEQLATLEGKRALADELKTLIEQPTQPGNRSARIDDVLFTEFVVQ
ncbi:Flagellar FliL protein [Burkholderia oklahomensis]|nr:Flagellar FliL protein [Burkholderia oklahomensis]